MKITEKIERKISRMKPGTTFKYQQLGIEISEYNAAAKAIERLIEKGVIKRMTTGVFYKPKQTAFGELKPKEEEMLRPYLFEGGKRIAYVTGATLYNRMGLTTQVPKTIKVASKVKRVTTRIGSTKVKPVMSYVDVNNENYPLLEILDALKDFKSIPDIDKGSAIKLLKSMISKLSDKEQKRLMNYALQYPPRTIALVGAILDDMSGNMSTQKLDKKLSPLTTYKLGITVDMLKTAPKWKIK